MKLTLLGCGFLFLSFGLSAQSKFLRGVIFEKGTAHRLSGVMVSISSKPETSQTDGLGMFAIQADIGDTLKISKKGYTDHSVVISAYHDLVIQLSKPIELAEVRIMGESKKQELDEMKREYRRKGSYHAGKPPLLSYIFTPLTALYELVGKTPGQARRFNNFYNRELQQSEIDRRFNSSSIQALTGYQGEDLRNFLQTYRPAFEELSGWADYDLVRYVTKSATAFELAGRPPAVSLPKLPRAPDLTEKVKL